MLLLRSPPLLVLWLIAAATAIAEPVRREVRQVVIRAPEAEVIALVTGGTKSDADLAAQLWQAVKEGRASVVSDVTSAAEDQEMSSVSVGEFMWLPSELDQGVDRLFMTPTSYEEHLVGTSLSCLPVVAGPLAFDGHVEAEWGTRYSPRGPLTVKWPTSWLEDWTDKRLGGKVIRGWLDWRDLFEESVSGKVWFNGGDPTLIAVLPPADQLWPGERKGRWLDVFLGQLSALGLKNLPLPRPAPAVERAPSSASHEPPDPFKQDAKNGRWPFMTRGMFFGLGVNSTEALALMAAREPQEDAALLHQLLARVNRGEARMHLCVGSANDSTERRELLSARLHEYPTEMPSIPSAWGTQLVGTHLETDGAISLHQDLAPPRRTEWKLATDEPEAIMWEPRFRSLAIRTQQPLRSGTHLLSALHIPQVMQGNGVPVNETVLIFSQSEITLPTSGSDDEAEMIVVEVPASEEASWQPANENQWHENDGHRLQSLLHRVKAGTALLAAHVVLRLHGGGATARITEDYMTAMEFDPPVSELPPRMRPTALESLPVGTRWEIDTLGTIPHDPRIWLRHKFQHSIAKPIEPGLQETLAIAANGTEDYPGAVHHEVSWEHSLVRLLPGQPRCLGTRTSPDLKRNVSYVAFVRVRRGL